MSEIQHYLFQTNCDFIFLEMFCLDPYVLVDRPFQPQRPFYYIPDITGGKEDIALSCVNEIDSTAPPKVAYSKNSTEMAFGSVLAWLLDMYERIVPRRPPVRKLSLRVFLEVSDPRSNSNK